MIFPETGFPIDPNIVKELLDDGMDWYAAEWNVGATLDGIVETDEGEAYGRQIYCHIPEVGKHSKVHKVSKSVPSKFEKRAPQPKPAV